MSSKCAQCHEGVIHEEQVPYRYAPGGLPHVILQGVSVGRCLKCGAESLTVPRIAQLHRVLAVALATKTSHLAPNEARFLRKYLGYSSTDLAAIMGVAPETVSRWESTKSAQAIGASAERLLRLLAVRDQPVEDYPNERMADIGEGDAEVRGRRGGLAHGGLTWN